MPLGGGPNGGRGRSPLGVEVRRNFSPLLTGVESTYEHLLLLLLRTVSLLLCSLLAELSAASLIALAADDANVVEGVCSAFSVWRDVVGFGTVWCSAGCPVDGGPA